MPNGTKHLLTVGVDRYQLNGIDLQGCVADALSFASTLKESFGFSQKHHVELLNEFATKERILTELRNVISGLKGGDVFVWYFAGHGAQVPDAASGRTSDEIDGYDEVLCPTDFSWSNALTDDEIAVELRQIPQKVNAFIAFDCCHSGTGNRSVLQLLNKEEEEIRVRGITHPFDLLRKESGRGWFQKMLKKMFTLRRQERDEMREVFFAACKAEQTAKETGGRGVFTVSLEKAISDGAETYLDLYNGTQVPERYNQNPQIVGGKKLERELFAPLI